MGKITVNAPVDKVFEAVSDLTRHAGWAAYSIDISSEMDGPVAVGHKYSLGKSGGKRDRITITDFVPNERLGFHVVMPNKWELDWQISVSPAGDGTSVERKGRITSIPTLMAPMKLLYALAAPMDEKKLVKTMKADLES